MRKWMLILLLPLFCQAQFKTGKDLIISLHKKNYGKLCKTQQFKQTTNRYRNDSLISTDTWTEYLEFPDKLRIEIGDSTKGNYAIYKNDSSYRFRNFKLVRVEEDKSLIMLLLGGMFYRKKEDVLKRMEAFKIDLSLISEQTIGQTFCYVVGAKENDESKTQVWYNKKTLQLERFIENDNGTILDVRVKERTKACGGETETKLDIYINGKLFQEELYFDLVTGKKIPKGKFDVK